MPPTEPMIDALPKDIIKKVEDAKAEKKAEAKAEKSDDDKKSIKDETTKADD